MTTPGPASATWRKSVRSSSTGQCVEVATLDASIAVRDSKAPHKAHLTLTPQAWVAFIAQARAGRYDQG
ncbi:DUF397 domain-containing protein [Actinomadura soli]|uniref:DUF397 domain-containing protein n=2 Tax=Actinomadura soli TaxID=2508997 RepID=A0A5C4JHD3_9ACTN|nr:DUF397 domain-containing protein [Actinomadura soli]